jgi:hypothetical protein
MERTANGTKTIETPTYQMTVDLNVLDHLGINLYSNISAVLTEVVANAWDADAENVKIKIEDSQSIYIRDDGVGMTILDLNKKYLRVGYKRRIEDQRTGSRTAKGRPVMGRKGLGKLSLFSIANTIEIFSKTADSEINGFRMTTKGIEESVKEGLSHYSPEPIPSNSIDLEKGTLIILKDIKRQRLRHGMVALRKRLSRRFSIIGEKYNFSVYINDDPINPSDRGDMPVVQFLWHFGAIIPDLSAARSLVEKKELPCRLQDWNPNWSISGWVGTATLPKQLDNEEAGNLNGIVVFARGRLFHENILDKLNDGRLYTKYLTGQIEADFLDEDSEQDIATSDRQRIQEDDPRYKELINFLKKQLSRVESEWSDLRRKHEVEKEKKRSPALAQWLDSLPAGFKKSAETLIEKLSALPVDDESDRKLMYKHGILAFERMKLRGSAEEFSANVYDIEKLLSLLADRDMLEASLYRDIVQSRLEAIKHFQDLTTVDEKEKVLQQYLFDHLWLLDPAWERATSSEVIETRLTKAGVLVSDLTEKEKLGRVDIAYRTMAGKHIIVELKRASRKMKLLELQDQGQTYFDKLKKILLAQNSETPDIEVIFVLGEPVDEERNNSGRLKASMDAISQGSRIVHYDTLIQGAQNSYHDYLVKSRELDRLESLVDTI